MSNRSITLETVNGIDGILEKECGTFELSKEKDRARLAWWIWENFIDGDLPKKIARRDGDVLGTKAPTKG